MPTRRDLATIVCYILLFAVVVLWAALAPFGINRGQGHDGRRAAMIARQLEPGQEQPEVRHLGKLMLGR